MKPRPGRLLLLVAGGALLSAAAGFYWSTAPASGSTGVTCATCATAVAVPADCAVYGCLGDPTQWVPPVAVDIGTVLSRAPH